MFTKVLCPIDGSEYGNMLISCLSELKSVGVKQAVLLHVIDQNWLMVNSGLGTSLHEYFHNEAGRLLNQAQANLLKNGVSTQTVLRTGAVANEVLNVAEEQEVDLIVIGALGQSLFEKFLLGGVAEKVARNASRPVLVQRFEVLHGLDRVECRQMFSSTFKKVLYPTDFSDSARTVEEMLKRLQSSIDEVIVFHVQDERVMRHRTAEQLAQFDQVDQKRLESICAEFSVAGIQAQARLAHGLPAEQIVAIARSEHVSLIAMNTRGRSGLTELIMGSVAENVVRHAPGAVLLVPPAWHWPVK